MPLTRSIDDMVSDLRYVADIGGTSSVARHPDAALFNLINRGIAAFHRKITSLAPDQRELSSTTISTVKGTSVYSLPTDLFSLLSLHIDADGSRVWLKDSFNPGDRAALTDPQASYRGVPSAYRLQAGNIEFLPVPQGIYTVTLYYAPNPDTLTTGETFDTISRLDDWVIWYAAKEVAKRDRLRDLYSMCTADMAALEGEILELARNRDRNAPATIQSAIAVDRFGRIVG